MPLAFRGLPPVCQADVILTRHLHYSVLPGTRAPQMELRDAHLIPSLERMLRERLVEPAA